MIAAIYSRKSKFTCKGESVENQVQLCKEYGQRMGATEYIIYEDEGFSGGNTERPKFKEMIKDAKNKKFDVLICYRLDRISRNVADFSNTLQLLQAKNIGFVSIREQFDTSTPMGRAMVYIASVFAQLERETIAERVKDNMLELSKTGRWLGGKTPLGFQSKPVSYNRNEAKEKTMYVLTPIAEEIKIIRLIYDKYLELKSIFKVAKYLNHHNIKLKNYKEANAAYIGEILSNPVYATADHATFNYFKSKGLLINGLIDGIHGLMPYNRTNGGKKKKDVTEWILAVAKHRGVISGEKWTAVQRLKETNSQRPPNLGKSNLALLSNLLICSKCGATMSVRYGVKRKDGERSLYYTCCNKTSNEANCNNGWVRTDIIEAIVVESLSKLTSNKTVLLGLLDSKSKLFPTISSNEDFKIINSTIAKNEAAIKNLVEQMTMLSLDASKFLAQKLEELTIENKNLKKELLELEKKINLSLMDDKNLNLVLKSLTSFPDAFAECETIDKRKKLLNSILERILWDGENKKVNLKLL